MVGAVDHSCHGENACRVDGQRSERARSGEDGTGRWRGGRHHPWPDGRAVLSAAGPTGTWSARLRATCRFRFFGSGDCVEPEQIVERMKTGVDGVLVGRGVLRNPWILAQAADIVAGRAPRTVTMRERGQFLLDYIDLLLDQREHEQQGFRHVAPGGQQMFSASVGPSNGGLSTSCVRSARGIRRDWTRDPIFGLGINNAESVAQLRHIIDDFFMTSSAATV